MLTFFAEQTKTWKFNEYKWTFKFNEGDTVLYIFPFKEAPFAMCAIPVYSDTLEAAQARSREWIKAHNNGYSFDYVTSKKKHRFPYEEPAREPAAPAGYEGPVCDLCGKVDDGDLIQSPADSDLMRCMVCFVGGAGT